MSHRFSQILKMFLPSVVLFAISDCARIDVHQEAYRRVNPAILVEGVSIGALILPSGSNRSPGLESGSPYFVNLSVLGREGLYERMVVRSATIATEKGEAFKLLQKAPLELPFEDSPVDGVVEIFYQFEPSIKISSRSTPTLTLLLDLDLDSPDKKAHVNASMKFERVNSGKDSNQPPDDYGHLKSASGSIYDGFLGN